MKRGNACGAKGPHREYCNIFNVGHRLFMTNTEQLYLDLGTNPEKDKAKVKRLRMVLGDKAKREPKFRFYSLYGHIQRRDVLYMAWIKVKSNKGSPGIDGITIKSLDSPERIEALIQEIQRELKEETYRPQPVKRVYIPKSNGKLRPLGIPTVKDRIIQMATLLVLEPIFEADFLDCSHGFRPERSAEGALNQISKAIRSGRNSIYDADLESYFDTIPHDKLLSCVKMRIVDRKVLKLIKLWLKSPVTEYDKDKRKWKQKPPSNKGTPQGGVISPLLANLYLHWFDKVFHASDGPGEWARAHIIRYADDFVIMARYISEDIKSWVEEKIESWMGLTINKDKTKVIDLTKEESLEFLGFSFRWAKDLYGREKRYLEMAPSKGAIGREKEVLREKINTSKSHIPLPTLISQVNKQIVGWAGYFKKGYHRKACRTVNYFVRQRLRFHLKRRSQRRYRPPEGISFYQHLKKLGLVYL